MDLCLSGGRSGMIAIILSFLAILGLAVLTARELCRAPVGWEDESGFHFGDAMGRWR
jgi:hypothetical protein